MGKMIADAEADGRLKPETIVEGTSGYRNGISFSCYYQGI
jgi:cysteine synthase